MKRTNTLFSHGLLLFGLTGIFCKTRRLSTKQNKLKIRKVAPVTSVVYERECVVSLRGFCSKLLRSAEVNVPRIYANKLTKASAEIFSY